MWELLGSPSRFDVVEAGAGRGLLAREVWRFARFSAPEWGEALHYTLVDSAAAGGVRDGFLVGGEEHIEAYSGETVSPLHRSLGAYARPRSLARLQPA